MTSPRGQRQGGSAWSHLAGALSLLATPLVVFGSTASRLYLENQDAFQHQAAAMLPFVRVLVGTVAIGVLLYLSSGYRISRWLLWAYYMVTPFFLLFTFLQNWPLGDHLFLWIFDTWAGVLLLLGLFLAATSVAASRLDPSRITVPLAAFSVLVLLTEAHAFGTRFEPSRARPTEAELESRDDLPNIYHVIFDGYDARLFPKTLTTGARGTLAGFVSFPGNVAVYRSTRMSLPSIFSGRRKAPDISNAEYMRRAFDSPDSLLFWLREAGYRTVAYVPRVYAFALPLFDRVVYDRDNLGRDALLAVNTASFERLWLFLNTPRLVTRKLLSREWFERFGGEGLTQVRVGSHLPVSVPITSYLSFLNVLEEEAGLPSRGRYTLIHLVIPHRPEVLASDCSYDEGGRATTQIEQTRCATRLLLMLVERLKELGRLDDSLVIVHADHGAYDQQSALDAHVPERVSLRALLLLKPVGRRGGMLDSDAATTVLDIAPTLLDAAGVDNALQPDGRSLLERLGQPGAAAGNAPVNGGPPRSPPT